MKQINRIIFVDRDGSARSPMAAEVYKRYNGESTDVLARGVFVAFDEPLNQKVEAILASDGIAVKDFTTTRLETRDITPETEIFVLDGELKESIIKRFEYATDENTHILSEYIGEELDIMNPYGGNLQSYGICYESIKNMIKKLIEVGKREESHE